MPALHFLGFDGQPVPRAHCRPPEQEAVRVFVLRVPVQLAVGYHQAHPAQVGAGQLAPGRQGADDGRDGPPQLHQVQQVSDRDGGGRLREKRQQHRHRRRGRFRNGQVRQSAANRWPETRTEGGRGHALSGGRKGAENGQSVGQHRTAVSDTAAATALGAAAASEKTQGRPKQHSRRRIAAAIQIADICICRRQP